MDLNPEFILEQCLTPHNDMEIVGPSNAVDVAERSNDIETAESSNTFAPIPLTHDNSMYRCTRITPEVIKKYMYDSLWECTDANIIAAQEHYKPWVIDGTLRGSTEAITFLSDDGSCMSLQDIVLVKPLKGVTINNAFLNHIVCLSDVLDTEFISGASLIVLGDQCRLKCTMAGASEGYLHLVGRGRGADVSLCEMTMKSWTRQEAYGTFTFNTTTATFEGGLHQSKCTLVKSHVECSVSSESLFTVDADSTLTLNCESSDVALCVAGKAYVDALLNAHVEHVSGVYVLVHTKGNMSVKKVYNYPLFIETEANVTFDYMEHCTVQSSGTLEGTGCMHNSMCSMTHATATLTEVAGRSKLELRNTSSLFITSSIRKSAVILEDSDATVSAAFETQFNVKGTSKLSLVRECVDIEMTIESGAQVNATKLRHTTKTIFLLLKEGGTLNVGDADGYGIYIERGGTLIIGNMKRCTVQNYGTVFHVAGPANYIVYSWLNMHPESQYKLGAVTSTSSVYVASTGSIGSVLNSTVEPLHLTTSSLNQDVWQKPVAAARHAEMEHLAYTLHNRHAANIEQRVSRKSVDHIHGPHVKVMGVHNTHEARCPTPALLDGLGVCNNNNKYTVTIGHIDATSVTTWYDANVHVGVNQGGLIAVGCFVNIDEQRGGRHSSDLLTQVDSGYCKVKRNFGCLSMLAGEVELNLGEARVIEGGGIIVTGGDGIVTPWYASYRFGEAYNEVKRWNETELRGVYAANRVCQNMDFDTFKKVLQQDTASIDVDMVSGLLVDIGKLMCRQKVLILLGDEFTGTLNLRVYGSDHLPPPVYRGTETEHRRVLDATYDFQGSEGRSEDVHVATIALKPPPPPYTGMKVVAQSWSGSLSKRRTDLYLPEPNVNPLTYGSLCNCVSHTCHLSHRN